MAIDFKPKIDFQPKVQPKPVERGVVESLVKRPLERLVLEPARRFGEAVGAAVTSPFISEKQKVKQQQRIEEDAELEVPFLGSFKLKGQKSGTEGAKQIAGEALESGAFLLPGSRAGSIVKSPIKQGIVRGAITGAEAGGAFGAGEALQEDAGVGEVLGRGAAGTVIGAGAGATLGGVLPLVPGALQATRAGIGAVSRGVGKTGGAIQSGIEAAAKVPVRIAARTAESVSKVAARSKAIRSATPHVGEAMKQGIDDVTIKFVQTGSKADKVQRSQMLDMAKKGTEDLTFIDNAKTMPGETILKGPVTHLINTADKGRTATKSVISKLTKIPQNVRNVYDGFVSDVQKLGLQVSENKIIAVQGSRVPEGDVKYYQQILNDLRLDKKGNVNLTFEQLHFLRQKWFDMARSDQTFTSGVTGFARHMRSVLAKVLDKASNGRYLEAQNKTREALEGLQEFVKLIGYKGKLSDLTTKELKAGETFLRIFGNAADRPMSVLKKLYDTASKYGYKGEENIVSQLRFADMLEAIYGVPSRSIGGQITKKTTQDATQVVASSIREMVKWSPYSGAIRFLRARGFLGKRGEDVLKAFEELIKGEASGITGAKPSALTPIKESLQKIGKETLSETKNVFRSLER